MLFPTSFQTIDIPVTSSVTLHTIRGGSGPPLLLLHGFPQTHTIWNKVAPALSQHYTIIAPDLRGYGGSSKPPAPKDNPDDHSQYTKLNMAHDVSAAMKHLGFSRYFVCGHDRGARVGHALATHRPSDVIALLLLDICPTLSMYDQTNQSFATSYWHWFFLIQPAPFPEDAITAAPAAFALKQMGSRLFGGGKTVMGEEAWEQYERQFRDWANVHSMCEDYRAAAGEDLEQQREDLKEGKKIGCRTRVLWGKQGVIERLHDARSEWFRVVEYGKFDAQGSVALDCGHYIPEEKPEELVQHIREFMRE